MYSTKGIDTSKKGKLSKYITCGGPQLLKINSMEIETAGTGSQRIVFFMETPPVDDDNFEGEGGAKGQIGKVRTFYMKPENQNQSEEFLTNMGIIADKLGVRVQVDSIKADDLTDYVAQLALFITGKYLWFAIKGEEYPKQDNTLGLALQFRRYGFVASEAEGKDHVKPFDKTNKYDYVPYVKQEMVTHDPSDL